MSEDPLEARYELLALAGRGGMGEVYRARDRVTGDLVAIKRIERNAEHEEKSHVDACREAAILLELEHPAIVSCLGQGHDRAGRPFFVMPWLEGLPYNTVLLRGGLAVAPTLTLIRRAAEALAVAHARGIVHRDIKPSNLFLVDGDPARTVVLDFGVARHIDRETLITRSKTQLGTVGYMSPEQADEQTDLDGRSDLFSLGCVLFEGLTGVPAFIGPNATAVLAKVLLAAPPSVGKLRPELPEALESLVASLLARSREKRLPTAEAVIEALDRIDPTDCGPPPIVSAERARVLTEGNRVRTTLLADVSTLLAARLDSPVELVAELARRYDAQPVRLGRGRLLFSFPAEADATSEAQRAVACATLLRERIPSTRLVVATGRADVSTGELVGSALDRGSELLGQEAEPGAIVVDDVTAKLLAGRFVTRRAEGYYEILRPSSRLPPPVAALRTPFVGRTKELALLQATFDECIDEGVARGLLVSGAAGLGKSRLAEELIRTVEERGIRHRLLMARGDPLSRGSAGALCRALLAVATGIGPTELPRAVDVHPPDRLGETTLVEVYGQLSDYLLQLGLDAGRATIVEPLRLLLGGDPRAAGSPWGGRLDGTLRERRLEQAFGEWLQAECLVKPVLIVLDDLQWGDATTLGYLGRFLQHDPQVPLMVLGLMRPEAYELRPALLKGLQFQELSLAGLSRKQSMRLAEAILRNARSSPWASAEDAPEQEAMGADSEQLSALVERAGGNAFFLQELTRALAERDSGALPETLIATLQGRIERLEPETRRVLEAASVFGARAWSGAIAYVLGAGAEQDVTAPIDDLVEQELLRSEPSSSFAGESAFRFGHELVREATYEMMAPLVREAAHLRAAEWLFERGESDASLLAEHLRRGGRPAFAAPYYLQASREAMQRGDLRLASTQAELGLQSSPEKRVATQLRALVGAVAGWDGRYEIVQQIADEELVHLAPASASWFMVKAGDAYASACLGDSARAMPNLLELIEGGRIPTPSRPAAFAMFLTAAAASSVGDREIVAGARARLEPWMHEPHPPREVAGWYWLIVDLEAYAFTHSIADGIHASREAAIAFADVGDQLGEATAALGTVVWLGSFGMRSRAQAKLGRLLQLAAASGSPLLKTLARFQEVHLYPQREDTLLSEPELRSLANDPNWLIAAPAILWQGRRLQRAAKLEEVEPLIARLTDSGLPRPGLLGESLRAQLALKRGDFGRALVLAEAALERQKTSPCFPTVPLRLERLRLEAARALGRIEPRHQEAALERMEGMLGGLEPADRAAVLETPMLSALQALVKSA